MFRLGSSDVRSGLELCFPCASQVMVTGVALL